jgi:hypothetical protein
MVAEDGLCGLKLHPKSESFTINTPEVREVVRAAADFGIPVIFHTDWAQHLDDIRTIADQVLSDLASAGRADDFKNLRLIVGHCGFYFDAHMFEVLSHPCIFGELSGLHGEGPAKFVKMARELYNPSSFTEKQLPVLAERLGLSQAQAMALGQAAPADWSRKFLLGTDFPFLNQNGTIETLAALFSKQLDMAPGELQNILGVNALRIIPPKFLSPRLKSGPAKMNLSPARRFPGRGLIGQAVRRSIELMKSGWTVAGLEYLVDDGPLCRVRTRQAVVTLVRKDGVARRFLLTSLADGGLEAVHPLNEELLPGLEGRCVRVTDQRSGEAHLRTILGAGEWDDEHIPELESLAAPGPSA